MPDPKCGFPRDNKPKTLYRIDGEVLLERTVKQLREAGIKNIRVVTGYGANRIRKFNLEKKLNLELTHNPKWDTDAIESLRTGVKDIGDDALILYSDILVNVEVLRKFLECDAPLAWLKLIKPWGKPWPTNKNDEIYRGDRNICIVKVAKEKLEIFNRAEEYAEQWLKRYGRSADGGSALHLDALLMEALYQNGPVEDIVIPVNVGDIDYYRFTDEGKEALRVH